MNSDLADLRESPAKELVEVSAAYQNSLNYFAHTKALKYNMITARSKMNIQRSATSHEQHSFGLQQSIFVDKPSVDEDTVNFNYVNQDSADEPSMISEQTYTTSYTGASGRRSRQQRSQARLSRPKQKLSKPHDDGAISLQIQVPGMTFDPPTQLVAYQEELQDSHVITNDFTQGIFRAAIQRHKKNTPVKSDL
jgi:hypothetical protein